MSERVVLAYSGGLDTSAIIPWLKDNHECEVIAFVGDVGQGEEDLAGIEDKARDSGASACYVVDLREEFIEQYVFPTLLAGAIYEGKYLLGTSMARPILARAQVEIARQTGADALCHGCTGKGNDQVRFESAFAALAPELKVIAPWREWSFRSREDLLNYLKEKGVPTSATSEKNYSRDRNLWHISHEGGSLESPWNPPPDDVWMLTRSIDETPDDPDEVMISFENGRPRMVNERSLAPHEVVAQLNSLAGKHGVGRIDIVENRLVGMKSRGCYETPGGTVLMEALRGLEQLCLDRETLHFREHLGLRFAEIVYNGQWFTPLREVIESAAGKIAERLTGDVVVRLHKGQAVVIRRRSPFSLYSEDYATFGEDEVYNQKDAAGFIRLFSLPSRIAALQQMSQEKV